MSDVDTRTKRRKRWPEAQKREIVTATLAPGASVSVVARQYDVNSNQVFKWRRRYRDAIEQITAASCPPPALVPVAITPTPETETGTRAAMSTSDTIEIEISGDCRVRVGPGSMPERSGAFLIF